MSSAQNFGREKQAELASSAGAGVLGAGLGALFAAHAGRFAPVLIAIGVAMHGWGMLERRRLQSGLALPAWANVLYWLCWIGLAALVGWIVFQWIVRLLGAGS
jgi:hypothetical protein